MQKYLLPHKLIPIIVCLLLLHSPFPLHASTQPTAFKVPAGLESKVNFWIKVYSEYTTDQVIIHDTNNLNIIYEVVDFTGQKNLSRRAKRKKIKKVKNFYKNVLRKLEWKKKNGKMGTRERKLYNLVKKSFWNASVNIRAQVGQKDRFMEGLRRSGLYIDEMRKIFSEFGLPEELTALPHVESSFQIGAYSKSGAAGIWQFIRSTGKRFLRINYAIDERRDPIKSTIAAAKLLKGNYEELGNWPLAITAYNHGLNGMKRAKAKLGSDDIVDVINHYRNRRFGFASGNFYAGFLAALEVSANYNNYFPNLQFYKPLQYDSFKLPDFVNIKVLSKQFKMTKKEIVFYNPSLRPPVLKSDQFVPAGFEFQVPKYRVADLSLAYKHIPKKEKSSSQKRTRWYRIHRGDNLSKIARRFGTSVKALKIANQLSRSGLIYAGQTLQLPGKGRIKTASFQIKKTKPKYNDERNVLTGRFKNITVKKHDTLDDISKRYKVAIKSIIRKNNIKNPNRIFPGQLLKIPETIDKKDKITVAKIEDTRKGKSESLESMSINKIELTEISPETVVNETSDPVIHLLPVSVTQDPERKHLVGFIFAEVDETIGHYAEWSKVKADLIRRINGFRYGRYIHLNQKIKIPFLQVTPDVFFQKRSEYHKSIQEDFFENYKVEKTIKFSAKPGTTVWEICNEIYDIPLWLLRRYNPNANLENLRRGEELIIPMVSVIGS